MGKRKQKIKNVPLLILSNEKDENLAQVLQTFYRAVQVGQIGLVMGMHPDTGEISPMLAGVDMVDGDIVGVYPLARLLQRVEEIESILIADGQGNYVSNTAGFTQSDHILPDGEAQAESGATVEQGEAAVS